jgi:hypothetical protein
MSPLQNIERKGTAAVKRLRKQNLADGLPFMINSNDLPPGQCYLEYPDGSIQLVTLAQNKRDFVLIQELSSQESTALRHRFNLIDRADDKSISKG